MIQLKSFDPECALWPRNWCSEVVFELALRLDQSRTLNREDEAIDILYQEYILDSANGLRAYAFFHALLKKSKKGLVVQMSTPTLIENAMLIGS